MRKPALILLSCGLFSAALAQNAPRIGVGVIERKITLSDALEAALKNNLDIEIERTNLTSAQHVLNGAKGAFDGIFRWNPSYENRNTPTSSVLFGANGALKETFHNENFNFAQKFGWQGASAQAAFENSRQTTSNPFTSLNPAVLSRLVLSYTQPLLRNRVLDRERAEIKIRTKGVAISQVDLELRVVDVVTRVEFAYWDLVAARQDVTVKLESVEVAREQLGRNQRMIDSGTLAPIELSAAKAELERREDAYYSSLGTLTEAENALKSLIAAGREQEVWGEAVVPLEERVVDLNPNSDLNAAISTAIQKRAELRQLTLRQESNDAQKGFAKDQLKPLLNVVANYTNSGLAGSLSSVSNPFTQSTIASTDRLNQLSTLAGLSPLPPTSTGALPPSLIGGLGGALTGVFAGHYQSIQAGLNFEWNPRNRTAEANLAQAVVAERRLKLEQSRAEQLVAAEVRNSLQAIQTARQRIVAAEAGSRAAKEKLDSETRLFQSGESTNFFVLTRQNEYTDAMRRLVVSRLDFNKAVARFHQSVGTILDEHKVRVN